MALTTATAVPAITVDQVETIGRERAKRVLVTFTSGYDSTTGVTLTHASCGLAQIVAVVMEGVSTVTGAAVSAVISATTGDATLTLWNGTTKVATSDQSATTISLLVLGH